MSIDEIDFNRMTTRQKMMQISVYMQSMAKGMKERGDSQVTAEDLAEVCYATHEVASTLYAILATYHREDDDEA